jgi:hypothetical protein
MGQEYPDAGALKHPLYVCTDACPPIPLPAVTGAHAVPHPHPPPFQIDLTLQRKDPSEFIAEEAEMARYRRLGCAPGTNTLRV